MKLSRDISLKIHWVFDQLVPPILRDQKWFMYLPIKLAFRHRADTYFNFKKNSHELSEGDYSQIYNNVSDVMFERETDLNLESIKLIKENIAGKNIAEIGCGGGYLSKLLANEYNVTAVDIHIPETIKNNPQIRSFESNIENLPFANDEFETVICTHTLEHVLNLQLAINELRRISQRLIIVVPKQRPYKYTFDLHINFFPYAFSFLNIMKPKKGMYKCLDADGDIFYVEDKYI